MAPSRLASRGSYDYGPFQGSMAHMGLSRSCRTSELLKCGIGIMGLSGSTAIPQVRALPMPDTHTLNPKS